MLKQSCRQSNTEDHENKLIIEKWMKRNSSNKFTIGQDVEKSNSLETKATKILVSSVSKNIVTCDVKVSAKKKVVIPVEISDSKSNNLLKIKRRSLPFHTDDSNAPKAKIFRQSPIKKLHVGTSLPTFKTNISTNIISKNSISKSPKLPNKTKPSIEVIPTKTISKIIPNALPKSIKSPSKTTPIIEVIKTTNNIIDNEVNVSTPVIKNNLVKSPSAAKAVKYNVVEVSAAGKGIQIIKHLSPSPVKCNAVKTSEIKKVGVADSESNEGFANNIISNLVKKEDGDVYTCLLENYRYLVTPKAWSVNEFTNEAKNRYVVFFNAQVIEEKGVLMSVMKKSLIVDKGGTMNYSVHGLPVDVEETILPKTLDNTKKLLSILHIFDKMQVCEGLGSDLNVVQNRVIFKDCCRYWRHKNCKIILIKATRCSVCTEARNSLTRLSEPEFVGTDHIKPEIEFIDVSVKTEKVF